MKRTALQGLDACALREANTLRLLELVVDEYGQDEGERGREGGGGRERERESFAEKWQKTQRWVCCYTFPTPFHRMLQEREGLLALSYSCLFLLRLCKDMLVLYSIQPGRHR